MRNHIPLEDLFRKPTRPIDRVIEDYRIDQAARSFAWREIFISVSLAVSAPVSIILLAWLVIRHT